jgi:hypothetical protein
MEVTVKTDEGKTFPLTDVTFAKNTDDGGVYVVYGNHDMKNEARYNECYIASVEG